MKLNYTFKQIEKSEAAIEFASAKIEKLTKFFFNATKAHVVFSMQRHLHFTEIILSGPSGVVQSVASADNFQASIEKAVNKINRQLARSQSKMANHKRPQQSKTGRLARMKANMEYDHQWQPGRRSSKAA